MKKIFTILVFLLGVSMFALGRRIPRPNYKPAVNGCGPQSASFDYVPDFSFEEACNGHDVCYGTCYELKEDCDMNFLSDMLKTCWSLDCAALAVIYYNAVASTQTGKEAYESGQQEGCIDCQDAVNFGESSVVYYCPGDFPEVNLSPIIASGFDKYDLLWGNGTSGTGMKVNPLTPAQSMRVKIISRDYDNGKSYSCDAQANLIFIEKPTCKPVKDWTVPIVYSRDPNDIIGPEGYGDGKMVSKFQLQPYTIRFENDPVFATAPAQVVKINLPLDAKVNPYSLRLGSFGFGKYTFQVPENRTFYSTRLNVMDSLGVAVDVTAGIDAVKKEAFWVFESRDPVTGLAPMDAMKGFLPVNDSTSVGEGYVSFVIKAADHTLTGDTMRAKASIVFDDNGAIETPPVFNTIDAFAPTSKITSIPAQTANPSFTVNWTGQDDAGGSGVKEYALYVSANGGPYKLYREHIAGTSTNFTGVPGNGYCFFTLATDNTGNLEAYKNNCEAAVQITSGTSLPVTLLSFKGQKADKDVKLTWVTATESNSKSFVLERSFDGSVFSDIATVAAAGNSAQLRSYAQVDKDVLTRSVKMIYYRLRQVDQNEKYYHSPVVAIPVEAEASNVVVNAYPNPFRQHLTIEVMNVSPSQQTGRVELYSLDGRLVYQRQVARKGNITVVLNDLPDLKSGIYLLKTIIDNKLYTIKVIRQ